MLSTALLKCLQYSIVSLALLLLQSTHGQMQLKISLYITGKHENKYDVKNKLAELLQPCQSQWFIMINYTATPAGTSLWQTETWFLTLIAGWAEL